MAAQIRILNVTRGFRLKPSQVERGISNCVFAWVEFGVSVRDCTLSESIKLRNEQAQKREPLAYAEIPGLSFEPPVSGVASTAGALTLIRAAHEFCMRAA